jgi:tetratricopeptide (TPR) repeat protein
LPDIRAQALRDRAYCFKKQQRWPQAIADLSTALALSSTTSTTDPNARETTISVLKDRAWAYLEVSDIDAALNDYTTASQLKPDDSKAAGTRDLLRTVLQPTSGFFFVLAPVGSPNGPAILPMPVQKLYPPYFLNLRFWWHPIRSSEVRYSQAGDEATAQDIVDRLRKQGIEVKGPVQMAGTVARTRRVELWLEAKFRLR